MIMVRPRAPFIGRPNLRRTRRLRVRQQAKIVCGSETMIHCEVRDLTAGGAKIAIRQHVALPEQFALFICAHDLRVHSATIRWRHGDFLGVSFGPDSAPVAPPQVAAHSYPVLVRSDAVSYGPAGRRLKSCRNAL
jgi:PilZ domain